MNFLIYPASILFVLSVLVFIHELGHYLVAKWCGVRVEVFSLGFGKRLFGFRRGETDYRVSMLPLGGYVKMAGENPMEDRTGDPGEFTSHPRWQRFLIAIAGPTMNIAFTIVVFTGIFKFHNEYPKFLDQPAVIGSVVDGSAAQQAGLQAWDKIVRIQDISNPTWKQISYKVLLNPNQPLDIEVQRGNGTFKKTVTPHAMPRDAVGDMGWIPNASLIASQIEPNLPAKSAGIQEDDEIVSLDGTPITDQDAFRHKLQEGKGAPVVIGIVRNGQPMKFTLSPQYADDKNGGMAFRSGMSLKLASQIERLPLRQAFPKAVSEARDNTFLVFELVEKLFQRKISITALESPVGMARDTGQAAKGGIFPLLYVMALISLQLGIFNLLPIPILDGGLMLMLLIEGMIRRDINQRIKERAYQLAFVCLILFASVVIFNDVAKSFHH
jgi:regulator of sigma E protease